MKRLDRILAAIPSQCPLAKRVNILGRSYLIQPCKLNPFYDQIMNIKFKAMQRLAETEP